MTGGLGNKRTSGELKQMDQRTRKLMTIVTAIGHGRIIMQGARTTMRTGSGGRRLAGRRALATVKEAAEKGQRS